MKKTCYKKSYIRFIKNGAPSELHGEQIDRPLCPDLALSCGLIKYAKNYTKLQIFLLSLSLPSSDLEFDLWASHPHGRLGVAATIRQLQRPRLTPAPFVVSIRWPV